MAAREAQEASRQQRHPVGRQGIVDGLAARACIIILRASGLRQLGNGIRRKAHLTINVTLPVVVDLGVRGTRR